jgi:hypothetical protein
MSTRDSETSAWARRGRRAEAERLAQAESARIDADTARREAELDRLDADAARKRAEAERVAAETTALRLAAERDHAVKRAAELEAELAAARAQSEEQPAAEPATEPATEPAAEPAAEPDAPKDAAPEKPAPPRAEPETTPKRSVPAPPESIRFAPRGDQPGLTIVLALASLAAAAAAVYLAYRDELTSGPGLLAAVATVVLAVSVGRMGRGATTVTIERGVVQVASARSTERADLTSPATLVELIGSAGGRTRKVMLVRETGGPLTVDDSMVDLAAFVEALRHWRPSL